MRTRVREQVRPDESAGPVQTPVRDVPVRRDAAPFRDGPNVIRDAVPAWRRAAPLTAEDAALPGRMLMLLSRLHRSELQPRTEPEDAGATGAPGA